MFDLNFVINGKVIYLHKEIKYVKRSESSFDDFSAKHTPCATLKKERTKSAGPITTKPLLNC